CRGVIAELDAQQKSESMNCDNLLHLSQTTPQVRLDTTHILEHAIHFDRFERRGNCGHREHATAKSGSQIILLDVRSNRFVDETCANRHTTAERLRQRHDIRDNSTTSRTSGKEPLTRTSNTGLNFIVDEHDAALVTQRPQRTIE